MKITIGGSFGMSLSNIPYSPVKAEATLMIEKEFDDSLTEEEINEKVSELNNKVEKYLHKNIEFKMKDISKNQMKLKKSLESKL